MMKLYKYRPLTELLFKEIYYQELFFASYSELNDPLDLSARIEFTPTTEKQVSYLVWFIIKTTLKIHEAPYTDQEKINNKALLEFSNNNELRNDFKLSVFNELEQLKKDTNFISIEEIEGILYRLSSNLKFKIDFTSFKNELQRLTKKFLENSYTTCFSEVNNDFLMWSHYASKHSGICLEFTLDHTFLFPYKMTGKRKFDREEYLKHMSKWQIEETIFWDRVKKVEYQNDQPYINFFDFSPVFENEFDCDLIGLSKSWTHQFAYELENVFSTKTTPWKYEKEWRDIQINFGSPEEPEERIRHYPIECLSGIYFGIRTPESAKKRVYKILNKLKDDINYYNCKPTSGRELTFESWEYYEE